MNPQPTRQPSSRVQDQQWRARCSELTRERRNEEALRVEAEAKVSNMMDALKTLGFTSADSFHLRNAQRDLDICRTTIHALEKANDTSRLKVKAAEWETCAIAMRSRCVDAEVKLAEMTQAYRNVLVENGALRARVEDAEERARKGNLMFDPYDNRPHSSPAPF